MESFEPTLSDTMNNLRKQGYTADFNLATDCIECRENMIKMFADDFKVDKFFRFEGMTDPADETILYAISSDKFNMKGLLVNGYGIYSDDVTDDLIKKLHV